MHDICVYRLIHLENKEQAIDFYEHSYIMREYGPDRSELNAMFERKERKVGGDKAYTPGVDTYPTGEGDRPKEQVRKRRETIE